MRSRIIFPPTFRGLSTKATAMPKLQTQEDVNWNRYGLSARATYKMVDVYAAFAIDKINKTPTGVFWSIRLDRDRSDDRRRYLCDEQDAGFLAVRQPGCRRDAGSANVCLVYRRASEAFSPCQCGDFCQKRFQSQAIGRRRYRGEESPKRLLFRNRCDFLREMVYANPYTCRYRRRSCDAQWRLHSRTP